MRHEEGSFRDPAGRIYRHDGRILRALSPEGRDRWRAVVESGCAGALTADGSLVGTRETEGGAPSGWIACLEHDAIPFLSWPYEWPFGLLRLAALHHLRLHRRALEFGVTLTDASAYNIQFTGTRPVFIDVLSLRPYREGEPWAGHRQFIEQFLNPLLFTASTGVSFHAWYRGSPEGIPSAELLRVLPFRHRVHWRTWIHHRLPLRLTPHDPTRASVKPIPRETILFMLRQLERWIAGLHPRATGDSSWREYERTRSYSHRAVDAKREFVEMFMSTRRPRRVLDIGTNTGEFAELSLRAGAGLVVGFDADPGALEAAVDRSRERSLAYLPLYGDATNPTPDSGWRQQERAGFSSRVEFDAVLALALVHHLGIGRNIPLRDAVAWIVDLAPAGVLEFVPKTDPMVQRMLAMREDVFPLHTRETFEAAVAADARIVRELRLPESERTIYWYERH